MSKLNADLIDDVAMRRAILFVGAGVSAGVMTNSGRRIRQWGDFLKDVASQIVGSETREHVNRLIDEKDHLMACEIVKEAIGNIAWEASLQAEFAQIGAASDLHRALIGLNQRIIVTTNFDKLLESAWVECNPAATHYPKTEFGITDDSFKAFRDNSEYIFKIHGTIDYPGSMIFSKSDYNQRAYGSWAYTKFVETMLMTHTVLFVGFSLNDPAIAFILEMYAQHLPRARPHYVFLAGDMSVEYLEISKRLRRIFVIPYSGDNGHAELVAIISELRDKAAARRREVLADQWKAVQGTP